MARSNQGSHGIGIGTCADKNFGPSTPVDAAGKVLPQQPTPGLERTISPSHTVPYSEFVQQAVSPSSFGVVTSENGSECQRVSSISTRLTTSTAAANRTSMSSSASNYAGHDKRRARMLPDADDMKRKMRENLISHAYDVRDFYWGTGTCQRIARHSSFEHLTILVIILYALWMAVDADHNDAGSLEKADSVFQIFENTFCGFFTLELAVRFGAFKRKRNCMRDSWFVFDFALVTAMVLETWFAPYVLPAFGVKFSVDGMGDSILLRLFRLIRVSRMSRIVRLLRFVPELRVLLKGLVAAFHSCCWTALLLVMAMYIWALSLKQLSTGTELGDKYFPSMLEGMYTLMMSGCFLKSFEEVLDTAKGTSFLCTLFYFAFVLFAGVAVMKMLTGMLCKVINEVGASETERSHLHFLKDELLSVMIEMGYCNCEESDARNADLHNLVITPEAFAELMHSPRILGALQQIGIDIVELLKSADSHFLFPGHDDEEHHHIEDSLSFLEFMETILKFRGEAMVNVNDMLHMREFIRAEMRDLERALCSFMVDHKYHDYADAASNKAVGAEMRKSLKARSSTGGESWMRPRSGSLPSVSEEGDTPHSGTTAEVVFKNLFSLSQVAEIPDGAVRHREKRRISRSELELLNKSRLCKLSLAEGIREETVDDALDAHDPKEALILLILTRYADHVALIESGNIKPEFEVGARVMATEDLDYKAGTRVRKATLGTVVANQPELHVDWDTFTTLDYAMRMLDYTEVHHSQIQTVEAALPIKAGMHVMATAPVIDQDGWEYLKKGEQGTIVTVDETGARAFVDFEDAGKRWMLQQNLNKMKFEAERTRLLSLLAAFVNGHAGDDRMKSHLPAPPSMTGTAYRADEIWHELRHSWDDNTNVALTGRSPQLPRVSRPHSCTLQANRNTGDITSDSSCGGNSQFKWE